MRIPTKEIPQADKLTRVIEVVQAVNQGSRSHQEIALDVEFVDRQGRYYRLATEILGLTKKVSSNQTELTDLGKKLISVQGSDRMSLLAEAILRAPLFQRLIPFLVSKGEAGCSREEIESFLRETTDTTDVMIRRRMSTVMAWLLDTNLLVQIGNKYRIKLPESTAMKIDLKLATEPMFPKRFNLQEYSDIADRTAAAGEYIRSMTKTAVRDRAVNSHIRLVNLVANKVRNLGSLPKSNVYIDLGFSADNRNYIVEVKSTTERNVRDQVRTGLSQLYEYRYIQDVVDATLILVVEQPLQASTSWMKDYLINDRKVCLLWDSDGDKLHCDPSQADRVGFLADA